MKLGKNSGVNAVGRLKKLSVLIKMSLLMAIITRGPVMAQDAPHSTSGSPEPATMDFNSDFLHGTNIDITRFSQQNATLPGVYDVIVYVNENVRGRLKIQFVQQNANNQVQACFSAGQLSQLGIVPDEKQLQQLKRIAPDGNDRCFILERWVPGTKSYYNGGDFELNLTVPQLYVRHRSDDYVDPSLWQTGETVGYLDYAANVWRNNWGLGKGSATSSGNLAVTGGVNVGEWRLRKRSNVNWSNRAPSSVQNLYTYVQRDITPLKAVLTAGQTSSNGNLFDSYSLRGVMLQTDERMLPTEMRNYSPIIRGVAETNARITVTQRGQTLYETIVPPGPFAITDLGAMGYGGELIMKITEADGRTRQQVIPFSAPPMLLREGASRFSVSLGQLDETDIKAHPDVFQATYHRGVMNFWTLYGGALIGEYYKAFGIGQAFNTALGGISFDVINARSVLKDNIQRLGHSYQLNYSKYLGPTDTNITLAAYRYTSKGYYTFRETALARQGFVAGETNGFKDTYVDYRTQNRFTASVNQRLDENKSLWFIGSLASYWNQQANSRQYSVSFNHALEKFSYAITGSRTRAGNGRDENIIQLSVSVPLGFSSINKPLFSSLYSSVSNSNLNGTQFQANASGYQGDQNELTYGMGVSAGTNGRGKAASGNLQYQSPYGQAGVSTTVDRNTSQLAGFMRGSMVAHAGGVTLGPAINDAAFAIVHADGATGAGLLNGQGAKVDRFGYAIKPSLYPYRENAVQLDAKGLPQTVDVLDNEARIYPRQGAAIAVQMNTISGAPLILTVRDGAHNYLPIGTELNDSNGLNQSVVGQGGQAFIRGWNPAQNPLLAQVGSEKLKCVAQNAAPVVKEAATVLSISTMEVVCLKN